MNNLELTITLNRMTSEMLILYCKTNGIDPAAFVAELTELILIEKFRKDKKDETQDNTREQLHKAAPILPN